ncbi:MAG: aspartate kinase [Bacteroidetes bacterium]|nr:aspartate kinase [Bacteroidota bacterium]
MIVYKFGGASVRDAWGIRNLTDIVRKVTGGLVIVVSAFGKTTNALERVLKEWFNSGENWLQYLEESTDYHLQIINDLGLTGGAVETRFLKEVNGLKQYLEAGVKGDYDLEYDQVVSYGEIWSTIVVAGYLNQEGVNTEWVDIREVLLTDTRYRDAGVQWDTTLSGVRQRFDSSFAQRYLTQGFIGSTAGGRTTTLGREGSDYTAAILANMLDATGVVVWKDVPGLLNADPKWLSDAVPLGSVSYKEAVEITFSGAKVIHPKTIKPLHNKSIPLFVRSFLDPEAPGTSVVPETAAAPDVPVFIRKEEQIMISILPRDFSFAISENLSRIFMILTDSGIKVNLVQASAVSINICADNEGDRIREFMELMGDQFRIVYNDGVEMITIRHYTPEAITRMTLGREVLIEQRTRRALRMVLREAG